MRRRSRGVMLLRREIWACYQKAIEFVISITECGALRKTHYHLCAVVCSAVMDKNKCIRWKVGGGR